jgi:hypothetical protein
MVRLLWTSDKPVAEASTYTEQRNIYTQQTNIHALSGIRTHNSSNEACRRPTNYNAQPSGSVVESL